MKFRPVAILCLLLSISAFAQHNPAASRAALPRSDSAAFEVRSRKLWGDFKSRNKAALSATLADGFRALEEGGGGFADAKTYLATLDDFKLESYELSEYTVTELGNEAALVTYHALYQGQSGVETTQGNAEFSEVWVRQQARWKIRYLQETYVKQVRPSLSGRRLRSAGRLSPGQYGTELRRPVGSSSRLFAGLPSGSLLFRRELSPPCSIPVLQETPKGYLTPAQREAELAKAAFLGHAVGQSAPP